MLMIPPRSLIFLLLALVMKVCQARRPSSFSTWETFLLRRGGSQATTSKTKTKPTVVLLPLLNNSTTISLKEDMMLMINASQLQQAAARFARDAKEEDGNGTTMTRDAPVTAAFVADTKLPTDVGHFRLRAYRIEDTESDGNENRNTASASNYYCGREPCVIYAADKPPPFGQTQNSQNGGLSVPVRVHDQCVTSEVFRSRR
jgi:hypothetical protein